MKFKWVARDNKWELVTVERNHFDYGHISIVANDDFTVSFVLYRGFGSFQQGVEFVGVFDDVQIAKAKLEELWTG